METYARGARRVTTRPVQTPVVSTKPVTNTPVTTPTTSTTSPSTPTATTPITTTPTPTTPPVVATSSAAGTSKYKMVGAPIVYNFASPGMPAKNATAVEPTTGATVRRLTDVTTDALPGQNLYNAYSRYPAENATGEYVLAITGQTTKIIERKTGKIISLYYDAAKSAFGDFNEIRWHMKTDFPYRVYFRTGQEFRMINDVRTQTGTSTLIKDFSKVINWHAGAGATKWIYCDQECNSSRDSDHWAFMAASYENNSTFKVRAFVHYQMSTDTVHTFYPKDLVGMERIPAGEANQDTFSYRPNMVEAAPDGSGILIHHGRAYPGNADKYIGTIFEAPYFFPNDFKPSTFKPFRMGSDATHGGWGTVGGVWHLLQQDNRRDKLMAIPISGANKGYGAEGQLDVNVNLNKAGVIDFFDDNDYSFSNGMHFTSQPAALDGWALISTYSNLSATAKGRANALEMMQIKPVSQNPIRWHIAPTFNIWPTNIKQDYNEGSAAINILGNRIHVPGNWNGQLNRVELLEIELPADWKSKLK